MVVCVGAVTIASCGVVAINIADDATVAISAATAHTDVAADCCFPEANLTRPKLSN